LDTKYYRVGLILVPPLVLEVTVAACWLITLGGVLRRKGREEFSAADPEHSSSSLWASLLLSAAICAGLKALEEAFYWIAYAPD
jgi:hypothetical protein